MEAESTPKNVIPATGAHAAHFQVKSHNIGVVTFRPLEAKLTTIDNQTTKAHRPYCKFKIGWNTGKTSSTKTEGNNVIWRDEIVILDRNHDEIFAKIKLKDRKIIGLGVKVGEGKIILDDVVANKKVIRWYNVYDKKNKVTGEILIDIEFAPITLV